MRFFARLGVAIVILCSAAFGQNVWFGSTSFSTFQNGATSFVIVAPGARIAVCNYPATGVPCTNYATIFTGQSSGTAALNPFNADSRGNFGFWATPGTYAYTVTVAGTTYGPFIASIGGAGGAGSTAFSSLTSGTNGSAAMLVGTGSSLGPTGSGTITATAVPFSGITSKPTTLAGYGITDAAPIANPSFTGSVTIPVTGSTQCVHVNTSGVISGTGSDCGAGGGGTTTNALTINNSGSGSASGSTFNGSAPITISYNSIGAAAANASTTINGVTCALAGTCAPYGGTVTYTANHTIGAADIGKLVVMNCAGACALTFSATPASTDWFGVESIGGTLATVSLNTKNFNGSASVPALLKFEPILVFSDGTNYFGDAPIVQGANMTITPASNGLTLAASASSGMTNPMTTLGDIIYGAASGTPTRLPGASGVDGVPQVLVSTPSGGVATAPAWTVQGVAPNAQTGTTYTVAATDRLSYVSFSNAGSIAVTLPQAGTTGFANNFAFVTCDIGAGTATITPTTSTISYSTGSSYSAAQTTLALTTGQCAWIYSDNTNYFAIVRSAGGGSGLSGMTSGQVAVAGSATTVTSSKPLLGTGTNIATTSASAPAAEKCAAWDTNGNLIISSTNAACGTSAGITSFSGDGVLINNSGSTGAVTATLGNAAPGAVWGNATASAAAPTYHTLTAINAQTTTYTATTTDFAAYKTISVASGTFTITLPLNTGQPPAGQFINVVNYGTGVVTIARNGQNLNGGTTSITLPAASDPQHPSSAFVVSDGTNYFASTSFPATTTSGTGSICLTTSCVMTTPNLGTPSAINLTNAAAGSLPGSAIANNGVTATQLAAQYSKGSCTEVWGGTGTSNALQSGDDAISNNTCYNDSGVTRTITAVKCRSDQASNTTTVNPTFGSAGTGTTILSGALTCGSSLAYSSSGTVTNASWTTGTGINPAMGGTLTGTSIALIVEYTY